MRRALRRDYEDVSLVLRLPPLSAGGVRRIYYFTPDPDAESFPAPLPAHPHQACPHEDLQYAPKFVGRALSARPCCSTLSSCSFPSGVALAQETGTVTGTVTRAAEGAALSSVSVTVQATGQSTVTGRDGKYTLRRVPAGPQTIVFRWLGYRPTQVDVTVEANATVTADAGLEAVTISLSEIVVEGASRAPERIVEAPAAISVVPPEVLQSVVDHRPGAGGAAGGARAWTSCRAASTTSTSTRAASTPRSTGACWCCRTAATSPSRSSARRSGTG